MVRSAHQSLRVCVSGISFAQAGCEHEEGRHETTEPEPTCCSDTHCSADVAAGPRIGLRRCEVSQPERASGTGSSCRAPAVSRHSTRPSRGVPGRRRRSRRNTRLFEASLADQAKRRAWQQYRPRALCVAFGHAAHDGRHSRLSGIIVTPDTTYILVGDQDQPRRIFTDGRDWPKEIDADLRRLLHRPLDRRGWRRQLRRARGRDPRLQGAARLRFIRPAAAPRQRVDLQGALLSRQG